MKLEGQQVKHVEQIAKEDPDSDHVPEAIDPVAEKKLLRKIDLFLMPAVWILMVFSYIDRSNLGNARVAGMYTDLSLDDQDYYYAVVMFQVGYVLAGTPSNMILARLRPSLYIPTLMFLWGTCATCLGAVQTKEQLWAIRFLLGITEAGFGPGVMFMISSWYRVEEQSKRFIFFLSAAILSGAFGGIIAGAIAGNLDGAHGLEGWRWLCSWPRLFWYHVTDCSYIIVEGVITVGLALVAPLALLDFPATSKKLTPAQRELAVRRLAREKITSRSAQAATRLGHWKAFISAVGNWRLYFLALPYMQLVGSSALSYFYPYLIQGLGYTAVNAQFMTAPLYMVALAIAIPLSIVADRFASRRGLIISIIMMVGGLFCALATGIQAYVPRYVFLCFINSAIWSGSPIGLAYASSKLGPVDPETRAVSLGIVNGLSQLAQVYGSALFPSSDAPQYYTGFGTYVGLFCFGSAVAMAGHFLLNKYPYKRDFE